MSKDKGFIEEIEWLKAQSEKEACSPEDRKMLKRIANNYEYTQSQLTQANSSLSWSQNPERMGR